jgi:outer membrane protein TolC
LGSDQAIYLDLVGQSPGALEPEPELKSLPDSIDTAFDVAEGNNPNLRAAIQTELSARAKVAETKAGNAPNFSLKLDGSIAPLAPYLPREFDRSASALITYTQSFFTGGLYSSNVRGAIEQDNKAIMTVESTRRQVIQNIAQSWSQYVNAKKSMDVEKEFIATARSEVNGDRLEHRAGQRGELDVLNGESDYISARLSYSQSHHDTYVAAITLINAMGLLKVRFLADNIQEYRPETSFERQARKGGMPLDGVAGWLDSIHAPAAPAPISSSLTAGGRRPADVEP